MVDVWSRCVTKNIRWMSIAPGLKKRFCQFWSCPYLSTASHCDMLYQVSGCSSAYRLSFLGSVVLFCVHGCRDVADRKGSTWRIFSLKELHAATNNFNYDNKLGEGGFGSVYWGQLWDGSQVGDWHLLSISCFRKKSFVRVRGPGVISYRLIILSALTLCPQWNFAGIADRREKVESMEYKSWNGVCRGGWNPWTSSS